MCYVSGKGGVETSADGPYWGRLNKFLGTEVVIQSTTFNKTKLVPTGSCLNERSFTCGIRSEYISGLNQ